jgi:hypothetical protein
MAIKAKSLKDAEALFALIAIKIIHQFQGSPE